MICICKPTRISIYVNSGRKSAAAIKKELGCDALINGGLFNMSLFYPNCWLRVDSRTLHSESWSDWGYGWETSNPVMDSSANIVRYRNFISCVCLLRNGKPEPLNYPADLGGRRGRSAIGFRSDGSMVLWCTQDGTYPLTPERLQEEMRAIGCVSALMLDSGGSSQCITPEGTVSASRIVHNFIAVWTGNYSETPNTCPYAEPTKNVRWGSIGAGAKWAQWQLNRHGAALTVDGIFGSKSTAALKSFQASHGLVADGICGPATRGELIK